jgi:hypothetical protein
MLCKHPITQTSELRTIGEDPETITSTLCGLKMRGSSQQAEIYSRLFELGFEGSMISNICPFASRGNWTDCPYCERA